MSVTSPARRGIVLLVEDSPQDRENIREFLCRQGHEVIEVESAERGLEVLMSRDVDLLVADYRLAGATGTWLARTAIQAGRLRPEQVILVTGYSQVEDAEGLAILVKPFQGAKLVEEVGRALAQGSAAPPPGEGAHQRIVLTLYVTSSTRSQRARAALRELLAPFRAEQISLTVVDVEAQWDFRAEEDRVLATPTLLRSFPAPRVWVVGDLAERRAQVEQLLAQAGVERRA